MFQKTLTGGRYNESNYPVQELWWKRGGGVLVGHYGICGHVLLVNGTIFAMLTDLFDKVTDSLHEEKLKWLPSYVIHALTTKF